MVICFNPRLVISQSPTCREKQEWATIEDEIADLEAKIEEIEAAMLENASDYGQLATLQRDLDAANETLLEKYERYEYLSELEG